MFRKLLDQGEAGDNVGCLLRGVERTGVERGAVRREGTSAAQPYVETSVHSVETAGTLSPALAAAKAEIHADLLRRHAAAIDISNRGGIRRLLMQLTEEHFRNKPPAALVTADDRERLVEILFDEVIGLGPLEAPLRDPEITEIMVTRVSRTARASTS